MEKEKLIKAFEFFYFSKYKEKIKVTPANIKSLEKLDYSFLKNEEDIYTYVFIMFARKEIADLEFNNGKLSFAMVFGQKSIETFINRNSSKDHSILFNSVVNSYIIKKDFMKHLGVSVKLKKTKIHFSYESIIRKQCQNTIKGFRNCIENTSLYDPEDKSCLSCSFKEDCIKILESNYFNLYIKRVVNFKKKK